MNAIRFHKFAVVPLLLLCIVVLSGCAALSGLSPSASPAQRYASLVVVYRTTSDTLTSYRQAGLIDDKTYDSIEVFNSAAYTGLEVMRANLTPGANGEPNEDYTRALNSVNAMLDQLLLARTQAAARQSKGVSTKPALGHSIAPAEWPGKPAYATRTWIGVAAWAA